MPSTESVMGCPWSALERTMRYTARHWHQVHGEVRDVSDYVSIELEALAKACQTYKPEQGSLLAYSKKFLNRACIDAHRNDHVSCEELEEMSGSYEMDEGAGLLERRIKKLLEGNPNFGTRAYEWIMMKHVQGMTFEEISEEVGVNECTVNQTVNRACLWLRGELGDAGYFRKGAKQAKGGGVGVSAAGYPTKIRRN